MKTSAHLLYRSALGRCPLALALLGALACEGRLAVSEPIAQPDAGSGLGNGGSGGEAPATASCSDGVKNGEESDIDCGGSCADCGTAFSCARHEDCESAFCRAGLCVAAACDDGILNGDETGIDCGGACNRCRSNTCNCASSPTLSAISCDETFGYVQYSVATSVTPDGRTALIFVFYDSGVGRTFRWTASGEFTLIGEGLGIGISDDGRHALLGTNGALSFVGGTEADIAVPLDTDARLSADGGTVVGSAGDGTRKVMRWSPNGGLESIADLPAAVTSKIVQAMTPDASAVIGYGETADDVDLPFLWTAIAGLSALAVPPNATGARPLAISDDGAVIVGVTTEASRVLDFFRWTESGGYTILGPAFEYFGQIALFVSEDGSIVAGDSPEPINGFRWTPAGGVNGLLDGWSSVKDMSPDGAIILGSGTNSGFLWTPTKVTQFSELLAERGVDLSGWTLGEPHKMAADGSVVFGRGTCGGVEVTYRLRLSE